MLYVCVRDVIDVVMYKYFVIHNGLQNTQKNRSNSKKCKLNLNDSNCKFEFKKSI